MGAGNEPPAPTPLVLHFVPVLVPLLAVMLAGGESGNGQPVPVGEQPVELPETGGSDGTSGAEMAALVVAFFAGIPRAVYLGWRLRRRPRVFAH